MKDPTPWDFGIFRVSDIDFKAVLGSRCVWVGVSVGQSRVVVWYIPYMVEWYIPYMVEWNNEVGVGWRWVHPFYIHPKLAVNY